MHKCQHEIDAGLVRPLSNFSHLILQIGSSGLGIFCEFII